MTLLPLAVPSTNVQPQALLDEKRALDDAAERHWQQQQMQIAVATARVRELEAAIQVSFVLLQRLGCGSLSLSPSQRQRAVFETEAANYDRRLTLMNEQLVEQVLEVEGAIQVRY